ncbi:MAG: hypothetical protein KC731_22460 [Myxococcales bacterium]|nr:hypothetical protein [Myxococcales bacterium]
MARSWRIALACPALLVAAGCNDGSKAPPPAGSELSPWSHMPTFAWTVLRDADTIELAALDPESEPTGDTDPYGGWKVLGRHDASSPERRRAVAAAVARGVEKGDGSIGKCFHPRHGLKVHDESLGDAELVICFACASMRVSDYGGIRWVGIEPDTRDDLDAVFEAEGLTIAP